MRVVWVYACVEALTRALCLSLSRLLFAQMDADNARSRSKTNLPPLDGDADLIEYYYIVMHCHTQSGFDYRRSMGKSFWNETVPRLKERYGEDAPGLIKPDRMVGKR